MQAPQLRNALIQLAKSTDDPKTRSESESLATHEMENFEFLLSMIIWHRLLFAVNVVSIKLQTEDIHIEDALTHLEGLLVFFQTYRETGFEEAMVEATNIALEMGIEPGFSTTKRVSQRKKIYGDSSSKDVTRTAEETFRIDYFIHIVDQATTSFTTRFEQFKSYEENFGFLLSLKKLKSLGDDGLRDSCSKLEVLLKNGVISDIDGVDLFMELKHLRVVLPQDVRKPIEVLNYLKGLDGCYPNTWISYRILLTIPVTVASAERSFSKLKLIKNYLRSTMVQKRLSSLALISIEQEWLEKLDYVTLMNEFASRKANRAIFKRKRVEQE